MTAPSTRSGPSFPSNSEAPAAKPPNPVPLLDLRRQYEQVGEEILAVVSRVCASQQYIFGPEVEALEREIAAFCGVREAVGCSSGTDALWLALVAAGVQPGDQVLTTPFSFFASSSAIARIGARPIFADIDPATFNLDPVEVERILRQVENSKMRALLPVHLYGQCADMSSLEGLAKEFDLTLIEDAAQAIGAAWTEHGSTRRAGSMGLAATLSFYPTKNLSAYGEAGMVTTNNPDMAAHIRRLRNHGSAERYVHQEMGWNCRLDAIQAAILRVKLKYVESWNESRRQRSATYDRLFAQAGLADRRAAAVTSRNGSRPKTGVRSKAADQPSRITTSEPIRLPQSSPQAHHVFHQYVVRAKQRDQLRAFLAERGITTEVYYPIPLHLQPSLVYLGYREGDFPQAERAAKEVLALPMFPELTEDEQRWVVHSIADFYS